MSQKFRNGPACVSYGVLHTLSIHKRRERAISFKISAYEVIAVTFTDLREHYSVSLHVGEETRFAFESDKYTLHGDCLWTPFSNRVSLYLKTDCPWESVSKTIVTPVGPMVRTFRDDIR